MALNSTSLEKTGAWYGFLNGLCLVIYGLILQFADLVSVPILRIGFLIISLIFICMSIVSLKRGRAGHLNYLQGIGVGAVTSMVGSFLFAVFTLINIEFFGSKILSILEDENVMGQHITVSSIFLVITMVGFVGGAITAYIAMQYYKSPDHKLTK
jgi:steroid 5-alpha reductase family enzyme